MPKILPNLYVSEMAILRNAIEMCVGDQTFVSVENKRDQKRVEKSLREARAKLERDDRRFSQVTITSTLRDGRLWVVVTLAPPTQMYIKRASGEVERAKIDIDPERARLIKCMVTDRLTIEEMNNILGSPLTETEIREYITKGRLAK